MDKDVKELIEYLGDKESDGVSIWGMENAFVDPLPEFKESLEKIFTEEQLAIITQLIKNVVAALKFHDDEQDDSHEDLRDKIDNVEAKLRNHRHDTTKTFSAKPEF